MAAKDLAAEADRIYRAIVQTSQQLPQSGAATDLRQLKQQIAQAQRDLRDVKRRLTEEEKATRLGFQEQRGKIAGQGQLLGMFVSSKTRGAMARGRAASRQSLAKREASALQPYRNVKAAVDKQLNHLQSIKEAIDAELAKTKLDGTRTARTKPETSSTTPPPPPPPTPPTWAADPSGRHQLRYWDGSRWTEYVSDDGEQTMDPI